MARTYYLLRCFEKLYVYIFKQQLMFMTTHKKTLLFRSNLEKNNQRASRPVNVPRIIPKNNQERHKRETAYSAIFSKGIDRHNGSLKVQLSAVTLRPPVRPSAHCEPPAPFTKGATAPPVWSAAAVRGDVPTTRRGMMTRS